jgi:hypothetical protein
MVGFLSYVADWSRLLGYLSLALAVLTTLYTARYISDRKREPSGEQVAHTTGDAEQRSDTTYESRLRHLELREQELERREAELRDLTVETRAMVVQEAARQQQAIAELVSRAVSASEERITKTELSAIANVRAELMSAMIEAAGQYLDDEQLKGLAQQLARISEDDA